VIPTEGRTLTILWSLWRARFRHAAECDLVLPGSAEMAYRFTALIHPDGLPVELAVATTLLALPTEIAIGAFRDAVDRVERLPGTRWLLRGPDDLQSIA
jgi:hypothetical protein